MKKCSEGSWNSWPGYVVGTFLASSTLFVFFGAPLLLKYDYENRIVEQWRIVKIGPEEKEVKIETTGSPVAGAVIGGLLLGATGAVIGSAAGYPESRTKEIIHCPVRVQDGYGGEWAMVPRKPCGLFSLNDSLAIVLKRNKKTNKIIYADWETGSVTLIKMK